MPSKAKEGIDLGGRGEHLPRGKKAAEKKQDHTKIPLGEKKLMKKI